jgi:hypothetical protein
MSLLTKTLPLLLITLLAASSIIMVQSAFAQSIPKPSVPEFTAKYVDRSYDTQPTYGLDQYTGKTVITKPSEHVDNRTIEITIKNQPFTPFTDENGNSINLLYNVRYKGSFGENWTSMFGELSEWAGTTDPYGTYGYPTQDSSAQYTTISFTLYWNMVQGQMDIQVEALVGYTTRAPDPAREHILWTVYEYTFYGEESGWSNTQTINFGTTNASASPTPLPTLTSATTFTPAQTSTPTTAVPEFSWLAILPLFAALFFVSVKLRHRKSPY